MQELLDKKDELGNQEDIVRLFDLSNVKDRQIEDLSGGELQRFACAMVCIQKGDIFMFDEPSSYLDVKQRLKAALAIRDIIRQNRFVLLRSDRTTPFASLPLTDTSSWSNTICPYWTIYPISFAFSMDHRDTMVL